MKIEDLHSLLGKYVVLEPDGCVFGPITAAYIENGNTLILELKDNRFPLQLYIENDEVELICFYTEFLWQATLYRFEYFGGRPLS